MRALKPFATALGLIGLAMLACDESEAPKNPFDPPPDAAKKVPPTPPPKPTGPPALAIDNISPKVGFSRVVLKKPKDAERLEKELAEYKQDFQGRVAPVSIERKVPVEWVVRYLEALDSIGVKGANIETETRDEYPEQVHFVFADEVDPPSCATVAMVLEDRATAVWKLSGGTASRRSKGMAGPDLTMTGETLQRFAKNCDNSDVLFVQGGETVEWGLVYDLAASAMTLEKKPFDKAVLLKEPPVPGHEVAPHP